MKIILCCPKMPERFGLPRFQTSWPPRCLSLRSDPRARLRKPMPLKWRLEDLRWQTLVWSWEGCSTWPSSAPWRSPSPALESSSTFVQSLRGGQVHKDKWSTRLKLENHSVPCSLQCSPVFLVMLLFNSGTSGTRRTRGTRNFGARCRSPRHAKT